MIEIPDPFYNQFIQRSLDGCILIGIICTILTKLNLISTDLLGYIFTIDMISILLICVYDKWEQSRYFKKKFNK